MTVQQFLAALTNDKMLITILDYDDSELVKLYAQGYEQLLASLLSRDIEAVTVVNQTSATIQLAV